MLAIISSRQIEDEIPSQVVEPLRVSRGVGAELRSMSNIAREGETGLRTLEARVRQDTYMVVHSYSIEQRTLIPLRASPITP